MDSDTWRALLVTALLVNAASGLGYRVYRLSRGGPRSDVVGQAILAALLAGLAAALLAGAGWPRWGALAYGLLFGVVVMPVWVLAVLIPLRPRALDYAFTGVYWAMLAAIVAAAIAL
jgi:small-conductance mechanosensitive channel